MNNLSGIDYAATRSYIHWLPSLSWTDAIRFNLTQLVRTLECWVITVYCVFRRYNDKLQGARKVGIKRGFVNGTGQGLLWFIVFGIISLAFWYGVRLILEPDNTYTMGILMQVMGDIKIPHSRMTKTCWEILVRGDGKIPFL